MSFGEKRIPCICPNSIPGPSNPQPGLFPTGYYGLIKMNNASCIKVQIGITAVNTLECDLVTVRKWSGKTRKAHVRISITARRVRCFLEKKYVLHIPSVVFVALGIQHVMGMRRILLSCPTVLYFSTLSHK